MGDDTPPVVEAEIVCCMGCGGEDHLEPLTVSGRNVYLCPFCRDTAGIVTALAKRVGMTVLSRMRKALTDPSAN